jgi:hypothetical protein
MTSAVSSSSLWLRSKKWDLTWITGSALLIAIPYLSFFTGSALGLNATDARNAVNILVAFFIGGPHMYATHTRTTFDGEFPRHHMTLLPAAIIIPAFVIYMGLTNFTILLTLFFFWASIHVLHQIIYLVDLYNNKDPRPLSFWSRVSDYAVVLLALYPIATYRFVHGSFHVGEVYLYFPPQLKHDATWISVAALFAFAVTAFAIKTWQEFRTGRGNWPKLLLISITVIASFITPMFHELDVAFQGLNTWHSFQYLGITWYINRLRYERGQLSAPMIIRMSEPRKWWKFYGFSMMLNSTALILWGGLLATQSYHGLTFDQSYYMVVLCFLLTHYYHDHLLFRNTDEVRNVAVRPA